MGYRRKADQEEQMTFEGDCQGETTVRAGATTLEVGSEIKLVLIERLELGSLPNLQVCLPFGIFMDPGLSSPFWDSRH